MASAKDMAATHRGPFVLCLLDGLALEAVEHLTLDKLKEENGDKYIWQAWKSVFQIGCRMVGWQNASRRSSGWLQRTAKQSLHDIQSPGSLLEMQSQSLSRFSK